nr:uncharacterized protein LOC105335224 [Crassostrea gigas]
MEEINPKSQIRRNSKSHEGQLPETSLKEDKATKVQEYKLCRTNGDVERPGGEKLKKSNNEAIDITQSKEEIHREEEFEPLLGDGKPDKKSTDSLEMEEINPKSQIRRNSKSHEGQLPTTSLKEDKATKVQGIDANHKSKVVNCKMYLYSQL